MDFVKQVVSELSERLGANEEGVYSADRHKESVMVRRITWLLFRHHFTLKEMGKWFPSKGVPRDHSTLSTGIQRIQNDFLTMPRLRNIYEDYLPVVSDWADGRASTVRIYWEGEEHMFLTEELMEHLKTTNFKGLTWP